MTTCLNSDSYTTSQHFDEGGIGHPGCRGAADSTGKGHKTSSFETAAQAELAWVRMKPVHVSCWSS